eukprot:TRINITY_DN7069_c0_g2_i1.p1 TRINITY_DN7069_c0_g2~~TRINITY_DN7069_c0_g2_i1.p1  ORF type:complete len:562 (+),score=188.85 TRINITY_DN7069_c0_g2_i1:380-2065(+)
MREASVSGDDVLCNASGNPQRPPPTPPKKMGGGEEQGGLAMAVTCVIIVASFVVNRWASKYWAESVTTIVLGAAAGAIIHFTDQGMIEHLRFDERTFVFYILPPIIFDAGFSLRHHGIVDNALVILMLAVVGTVLTTGIVGALMYAAAPALYPQLHDASVWETMCFAALLSAIDPVAVLSVLGRMFTTPEWARKSPPRIFYVIFGESVLNDAVAIVIFKIFEGFLESGEEASPLALLKAAGIFLYTCVSSVLIGWLVAALSALLLKSSAFRGHPSTELTILLTLSFGSYYLTEALGLSGIIALFVCGRTTGHYTWHNLSTVAQVTAPQMIHWLASIAETYVYAFLGLAFFSFEHTWRWGFSSVVLAILIFSRFACVFPVAGVCNAVLPARKRLSLRTQLFMSLTGLRGAIAFGLALSTTSNPNFATSTQMVSTTLFVVVVTVVVFGNQAKCLFGCLGLAKAAAAERDAADPAAAVTSKSKFVSLVAFEAKHLAPRLRAADHRNQHSRRAEDMHSVLFDLQNRFAVQQEGPAGAPPPAASEPTQADGDAVEMGDAPSPASAV